MMMINQTQYLIGPIDYKANYKYTLQVAHIEINVD